jgi:hypothetical protein
MFWYLYPTLEVATVEFHEKWVKEFLPKGEFKNHPKYGWTEEYRAKKIHCIRFNSGVTVYFRSYAQDSEDLQTASLFAIFCDEELPIELYPELNARISAASIRGYWHMCFTATIGQEQWRLTMEERGTKHELFKKAFKLQVSLYDCKKYMDGKPSPWTDEIIQETVDACATDAEVQRRVWGKFVLDEGLMFSSFSKKGNVTKSHALPKNWTIWTGIDYGSGGKTGHPASIVFLGVSPDFTQGRVFKAWRGDKIETTAGDILDQYTRMKGKMKPVGEFYDHQHRDLYTVAQRRKPAIPLQKAEKGQDVGISTMNTLFKLEMLKIYEDDQDTEIPKLVQELMAVRTETPKPKRKDDLCDALRFAVAKVPWNYAAKKAKKVVDDSNLTEREREWNRQKEARGGVDLLEAEIDLANEAFDYEGDFGGLE